MGNKKVRAHGLHIFLVTPQLTARVFDAHLRFDETTESDWAKVDVPDAVVNLFEPDILASAGDADIHPIASPADAAVVADIAPLEVRRIFQVGQLLRVWARARLIERGRRLHRKRFVRTQMVIFFSEGVELALLGTP